MKKFNLKKLNLKSGVVYFVAGAMTMASVPVVAKTVQERISVTYRDIKVCVDGVNVDTSGAEPFIYNGTTYLPIRKVGEAFNKPVNWDGGSGTVYIGNYANTNGSSFSLEPYENRDYESFLNGKSFMVSGTRRSNGFVIEGRSYDDLGYAIYNLDGKYTGFTFNVGHVDGSYMNDNIVTIYLDGKIAQEIEVGAEDMPQKVTVPVNGALQMKIKVSPAPDNGGGAEAGFFDVKLY